MIENICVANQNQRNDYTIESLVVREFFQVILIETRSNIHSHGIVNIKI